MYAAMTRDDDNEAGGLFEKPAEGFMARPIIEVTNLSKSYSIGKRESYGSLRDEIMQALTSPFRRRSGDGGGADSIWALKDVSFDVEEGTVLGIIGRNGAGKSTLLKILSRITEPTSGRITMRGRVASLLEVGTGFHPELTGRENIFLNGALLGMTSNEIRSKFDEIVAFSEIEKFLDTPVKRYSSGMYVRLAFAVAAHLDPEILVIDEVLAVGDAEFQKKCLGKMNDVAKGGRTVLFVSHNMGAMQTLCTQAVRLKAGQIEGHGPVNEQIELYLNSDQGRKEVGPDKAVRLGPDLLLRRFEFTPNPVECGSGAEFTIELDGKRPSRVDALTILIYSSLGVRVAVLDLRQGSSFSLDGLNPLTIRGSVKSLSLVEGVYSAGLYVNCGEIRKNFQDLVDITVTAKNSGKDVAPYRPDVRGILELDFEVFG